MGDRRRGRRTKRAGASRQVAPYPGATTRAAAQPRIHFPGTRRPRHRTRLICPCCEPGGAAGAETGEDFEADWDELGVNNVTMANWDDGGGRQHGRGRERRGRGPAAQVRRRRQRKRQPTLAEQLAPLSAELCEDLNERHAGRVLAYARAYAPAPGAVSAQMLAVLPNGFELRVIGTDGLTSCVLARYPRPLHSAGQVRELAAAIRAGELPERAPTSPSAGELLPSGGARASRSRSGGVGVGVGVAVAALAVGVVLAVMVRRPRR